MPSRGTSRPQLLPVERRRPTPWAWRSALILSLLALAAAAVLTLRGEPGLSDLFITVAFTMGLLAGPLWLFTSRPVP